MHSCLEKTSHIVFLCRADGGSEGGCSCEFPARIVHTHPRFSLCLWDTRLRLPALHHSCLFNSVLQAGS